MKRKIISLLLAIALLALPLLTATSCDLLGGGKNNGDGELKEGQVKVVFYHTMGEALRTVLDKYIVEFNKLYPDIIIEHKQVGGYDDVREQIKTEITVGDQPNLAYCYPDHVAAYNIAYAVKPLDELISSTKVITRADGTTETLGLTQAQIDDFIDAFYAEGAVYGDGKMYTLPMSKSTEVLYYNKTFFDANGLVPPTTWDEMEVLCEKLLELDPDCIPFGYDSEGNFFITMCEQLGTPYTSATGDLFLFDNAENRAFVEKFRSWYEKGYFETGELSGVSYTSGLFTKAPAEEGNCYMCIGSSGGANHQKPKNDDGTYKFEVGITSIPQVDPSNPKVISQGPSLCIFDKADPAEVEATWLFAKFLTTNVDFQAEFSMTSGYMPVLESVKDHPVYAAELEAANGKEGLTLLTAKVALEQANAYYTSPAFNGSSTARDQVGLLMQQALPLTAEKDGDVAAKIKALFEDAIYKCKYDAGLQ